MTAEIKAQTIYLKMNDDHMDLKTKKATLTGYKLTPCFSDMVMSMLFMCCNWQPRVCYF